jgi:hypothetical protein
MRQLFTCTCCLAVSIGLAQFADAQGPVRRAVRGAAEATAGAARGAADVTAGAARATAQGVRAVTPGVPVQASAGGAINPNATWRTQRYNGDWWYYTPQNNWMVYRDNQWTPYSADTFQPNQQYAAQSNNSQQSVFIDSGGRAVICQNGQVAFIDGTALQTVSRSQVNAQGYLIQQGVAQNQLQSGQNSAIVRGSYQPEAGAQQSTAGQVNQTQGAAVQGQAAPQAGASAESPSPPAQPSASTGAATSGQASNASTPSSSSSASASAQPSSSNTGSASADANNPNSSGNDSSR